MGSRRIEAAEQMGPLQRLRRSALGKRRTLDDAPKRAALHRPRRHGLDRASRIASGWRIYSAIALVAHGRTVRRKISERVGVARCLLRPEESATRSLRPYVLQRDALQRRERSRSRHDVLRATKIWASLESAESRAGQSRGGDRGARRTGEPGRY